MRMKTLAYLLIAAIALFSVSNLKADGVLYGSGGSPNWFTTIDTSTGMATGIGLSADRVDGLAFDVNSNTLYGSVARSSFDSLVTVDPSTGQFTVIGQFGFGGVVGLAYDPNTDILYGSDVSTDQLITIDITTGAGTAIGPLGFELVGGLAFDPNTETLYAADNLTNQLLTVDTVTGSATSIGPIGSSILGLGFDPNTNVLYGADFDSDSLVTINTTTGAGTVVGPWNLSTDIGGLAFNPKAIPEPSSTALLGVCLIGAWMRRRRS